MDLRKFPHYTSTRILPQDNENRFVYNHTQKPQIGISLPPTIQPSPYFTEFLCSSIPRSLKALKLSERWQPFVFELSRYLYNRISLSSQVKDLDKYIRAQRTILSLLSIYIPRGTCPKVRSYPIQLPTPHYRKDQACFLIQTTRLDWEAYWWR